MPAKPKSVGQTGQERDVLSDDIRRAAATLNDLAHDGRRTALLSPAMAEHLEALSDHLAACSDVLREGVSSRFPPPPIRSVDLELLVGARAPVLRPRQAGDWNPEEHVDVPGQRKRGGAMRAATGPAGVTVGGQGGTGPDPDGVWPFDDERREARRGGR